MFTPKANLVSVTFNRLEFTKQTLPNIRETASDTIPYYLTVVDNGSTDGTVEYLKELFDNHIIDNLILLKENIGVAKGSNLGWRLFDEVPVYAKIDNDVLFSRKNWLDDILHILENAPEIGALGYNCETKNIYSVTSNGKVSYRFKGGNIGGACHFIPSHIKEVLGYWNENFDKYGEEDADYGIRIMYAGFKNAYMGDETVITHLGEPESDYVLFKREQRQKNLEGILQRFTGGYLNKTIPLYNNSDIENECEYQYYSHHKERK